MVWGLQQWLIEHIYLKNLRNPCRNEWETIVWSFAAKTAQKSSGMAAVPTILKTAMNSDLFPTWVRVFLQSPCRLHIKIALIRNWTSFVIATNCTLYHLAIVASGTLLTCAIYVAYCLIGKQIYFYSIWVIWYMSWTSFSMWIQWRCPFCDQTNHIQ